MKNLLFLFILTLAFSTQIFAVEFMVNLTTDQHDANTADNICDIDTITAGEQCTIRAAVEQANALSSDDLIRFNPLPANSTITLTTANGGEIPITNNGSLTMNGLGADLLTIDGGAGTNRIFYINNATATITGVTLTGGNGTGAFASGHGGAIYASGGTLVLNSVHVTANSTASTSNGGGVYFNGGTNHQILNSTISANNALNCGGFLNLGITLTVTNSTISGNSAQEGYGGGFCNSGGSTTLRNVTITANTAGSGGGIYQNGGTINLGNTIVAANNGGARSDYRLDSGTATTAGYNLIGINMSVGTTFPAGNPNANNDIVGTLDMPIDPGLEALAVSSEGTNRVPTHALRSNSPAIDRGNSFGVTNDERGLARPVDLASYTNAAGGDGSDIGAFEAQTAPAGPTAASVTISGRVTTASGRGIRNVQITLTDLSGNEQTAQTTAFGYYRFDGVTAGETVTLSVKARKFKFVQSSIVRTINESIADADFVSEQ